MVVLRRAMHIDEAYQVVKESFPLKIVTLARDELHHCWTISLTEKSVGFKCDDEIDNDRLKENIAKLKSML